VFERFTERSRQVVVLAQDEARALKHNYIGTEHILLGLLREEEGVAARVLEGFDVAVDEVRAQIARIVGEGDEVSSGQIPFTPRAKKVLELALREAMALGSNYIGTEHILLGVARENQGVAARILLDFDVDAETIRHGVLRALGGGASRPRRSLPGSGEEGFEETFAFEAHEGEGAHSLFSRAARSLSLLEGWLLFGISLGVGILIGWAIWGR
jgi:ATP-dependent Clp protease ATP-binding subunit ClpC